MTSDVAHRPAIVDLSTGLLRVVSTGEVLARAFPDLSLQDLEDGLSVAHVQWAPVDYGKQGDLVAGEALLLRINPRAHVLVVAAPVPGCPDRDAIARLMSVRIVPVGKDYWVGLRGCLHRSDRQVPGDLARFHLGGADRIAAAYEWVCDFEKSKARADLMIRDVEPEFYPGCFSHPDVTDADFERFVRLLATAHHTGTTVPLPITIRYAHVAAARIAIGPTLSDKGHETIFRLVTALEPRGEVWDVHTGSGALVSDYRFQARTLSVSIPPPTALERAQAIDALSHDPVLRELGVLDA